MNSGYLDLQLGVEGIGTSPDSTKARATVAAQNMHTHSSGKSNVAY